MIDISGRMIPAQQNGAQPGSAIGAMSSRIIAVPPVRYAPNEVSQEFLYSAYGTLAAGGAGFVSLLDPVGGGNFAKQIPDQFRARVDAMLIFCPDMVAAAAPYLFAQMQINGQPANAWGFVPIYPRAGVASLAFDTDVELAPQNTLTLFGENTDAVNTHFLTIYLHGWVWPKNYVDQ